MSRRYPQGSNSRWQNDRKEDDGRRREEEEKEKTTGEREREKKSRHIRCLLI